MFFNKKEDAFKKAFIVQKVKTDKGVIYKVLTEKKIPGFKKPRMVVVEYTPLEYKAVVKLWYKTQ